MILAEMNWPEAISSIVFSLTMLAFIGIMFTGEWPWPFKSK